MWISFADITLYKGLVFRAEYAGNYYYNNNYQYTPSYDYGLYTQESLGSRSASNGSNWTLKTYLTYTNTFGRHQITAMAGHEAQENNWESLSGTRVTIFSTLFTNWTRVAHLPQRIVVPKVLLLSNLTSVVLTTDLMTVIC